MKVLVCGGYEIHDYDRGRIMYNGLLANGVDAKLFLSPKDTFKNHFKRFLKANFDAILVSGKPALLAAWLTKPIHRKPIIFDVFISDYDSLVLDRQLVPKSSIKAKLLWLADWFCCRAPNLGIYDTKEHINYFVNKFGAKNAKCKEVIVGADETLFRPMKRTRTSHKFIVLFQGTFIPLQGIEYILGAAKILEKQDPDIHFEIIGSGQKKKEMVYLAKEMSVRNVDFFDFMPLQNLPQFIKNADICLGIFGKSNKTKRVIPNKAYEAIAMKKPLITSDTPAIRDLFTHLDNVFLCKAQDDKSLANAVISLKKNKTLRDKIAKNGYDLYKQNGTSTVIGKELRDIIHNLI